MPPELVSFTDFRGDWTLYENALYEIFHREIVHGELIYEGQKVSCRRHPEHERKWVAFWHLIQEGLVEEDRIPDLRRCERLKWIPWIIGNANIRDDINVWENVRKTESNTLLWYCEEYLVVLAKRSGYRLLKTAYCTSQRRRVASLRKERDAYLRLHR